MHTEHRGSCLCQAVRFKLVGEIEHFFLCHCAYCRKDTGSAHAANVFLSTATVEWLSGAEHVRCFDLPATRHRKCFCGVCGSALPHASGSMQVVPAGCLDTPLTLAADAHIFMGSRADWDHDLAAAPRFDTFPQ